MLTVFVSLSLVEPQCPCRDVGEVIPVASLRRGTFWSGRFAVRNSMSSASDGAKQL